MLQLLRFISSESQRANICLSLTQCSITWPASDISWLVALFFHTPLCTMLMGPLGGQAASGASSLNTRSDLFNTLAWRTCERKAMIGGQHSRSWKNGEEWGVGNARDSIFSFSAHPDSSPASVLSLSALHPRVELFLPILEMRVMGSAASVNWPLYSLFQTLTATHCSWLAWPPRHKKTPRAALCTCLPVAESPTLTRLVWKLLNTSDLNIIV